MGPAGAAGGGSGLGGLTCGFSGVSCGFGTVSCVSGSTSTLCGGRSAKTGICSGMKVGTSETFWEYTVDRRMGVGLHEGVGGEWVVPLAFY